MPAYSEQPWWSTPITSLDSDEIVISGISGKMPESNNLWEYREHLFNGDDMVTEDDRRWPVGLHGLPTRAGKLKELNRFDASFFGVLAKHANRTDPQLRMLLELAYEAVADAGVDPQSLRGSNTGVYIGISSAETEDWVSSTPDHILGFESLGCARPMIANRISYHFDLKGPSFILDTGCSSSLVALTQAIAAIRTGACDAAIVGGTNICLKPCTAVQSLRFGMLAVDGKCKVFDVSGDGFVRSETVSVIYIQRSSVAKRIYATLVHCKTNTDGYKIQGVTYPAGKVQEQLLRDVYREANVDPADVVYLETHGTGTKAGDPQELNAVANVFCKNRTTPFLVGAVKSNVGHTEAASGMCAIAKVILAMESGAIPPNLHFKEPNPEIPALLDGRLKVVTEKTPFHGGLVGISSFGFGGANAHLILRFHPESRPKPTSTVDGLTIFAVSGRTEEAVDVMLKNMEETRNRDVLGLMADLSDNPHPKHYYRGYTLLNGETVREIQEKPNDPLPIWYIFTGAGAHWVGMAVDLLQLDVFKKTIQRLTNVMKPYGVDIMDLIVNATEESQIGILYNYVTVAAIQVALVDSLRHVGIEPNGMVGHSVGELGCAYADGCFTGEQVVLSAYWRGRCVLDGDFPEGSMVAIGISWEEAKRRCPPGVLPACHNAVDNVTISGEAAAMRSFVAELQKDGIFTKEVIFSNIAFHCPLMNRVGPALLQALGKVIPNPKPRSSRWISTSIPEENWASAVAQHASAAYFVNNLTSSVLFQEGLCHVPKNAIVIEIAPHGLLQAILKQSIGTGATYLTLSKKNHPNNLQFFLTNLGKLYLAGAKVTLSKLYSPLTSPVYGAPMIAPLVRWDHSVDWKVISHDMFSGSSMGTGGSSVEIDISSPDSDNYYLVGHNVDGRVLFPATGYLVLAWKAFAGLCRTTFDRTPVVFEDVQLKSATILPKSGSVKLRISMMAVGGEFEISESGTVAVSGRIRSAQSTDNKLRELVTNSKTDTEESSKLSSEDIYKVLRLRGYDYGPTFQGIVEANMKGTNGVLTWNGNWVTFLDTVLQFFVVGDILGRMALPTNIGYVKIDPEYHTKILENKEVAEVTLDPVLNVVVAGGVEVNGLNVTITERRPGRQPPSLEENHFVPYEEESCFAAISPLVFRQMSEYYAQCISEVQQAAATYLKGEPTVCEKIKRLFPRTQAQAKAQAKAEGKAEAAQDSSHLKNMLREVLSSKDRRKESVEEMFKDGEETDDILNSYLKADFIKPHLDLVRENCSFTRLKVAEANATGQHLATKVTSLLNTHPLMNVDYVRTVSTVEESDRTDGNNGTSVWNILESPFEGEVDLVIAKHLLGENSGRGQGILKNIFKSLKSGGFALFIELKAENALAKLLAEFGGVEVMKSEQVKALVEEVGFKLAATRSDGFLYASYLIRKVGPVEKAIKIKIDETKFDWLEEMKVKVKELSSTSKGTKLWVMSEDQPTCGVIGFVNCLRQEEDSNRIRAVFNSNLASGKSSMKDVDQQLEKDLAINVFRDGKWGFYAYLPLKDEVVQPTTHCHINVLTPGDMSSIRWVESSLKYPHGRGPTVDVYYASLNFRDIMMATAKIGIDSFSAVVANTDLLPGSEYSGMDGSGQRLMGIVGAKGLATCAEVVPWLMWTIPDKWTLEDAVTVPVVYATSYCAFLLRANLQPGQTVLIHSGTGGVGQAAINITLSMGCQVFTTVGSKEKREHLKMLFPQLTDDNIFNSRDTSFRYEVLKRTNGEGVHVVLNSLADDKLIASIRCLKRHGVFLEIGKFDILQNTRVGLFDFRKDLTYHSIFLDTLLDITVEFGWKVNKLVQDGIHNGVVKPLGRTVFEADQSEAAFRYMASGKHVGKVVLKIRNESSKTESATAAPFQAFPRALCDPSKSYIVTGGLGGFGLELANWLVLKGARNLVLTSRSGVKTSYQERCVRMWKLRGVHVQVSTENVATMEGAQTLLKQARKPVGGIFHLAMVLIDNLLENQTVESYRKVTEPKIEGIRNLDAASRNLCPDLHWFVVFSSMACGRGNAGQTNYGFANSTMERICEKRKQIGLHGLAIQWGAIGDVGAAFDMVGGNDVVMLGTFPQRMHSCLTVLDRLLTQSHPVVSSLVIASRVGSSNSELSLVDTVANILGIADLSTVRKDTTFADLGIDSMMAVEIRLTLERNYDVVMSAQEIRQLTFAKMEEIGKRASGSLKKGVGDDVDDRLKHLQFNVNEILPKECVVLLNSADTSLHPLFIIHPVEGTTFMLKTLANKIKHPVYGVQNVKDSDMESISHLAAYYLKEIEKIQPRPPYKLAAYSYGGILLHELTVQICKKYSSKEAVDTVIFLEGSQNTVMAMREAYYERSDEFSEEDKHIGLLTIFLNYFIAFDHESLRSQFSACASWDEKVEIVAQMIGTLNLFPNLEDVKLAALMFYKRLVTAFDFDVTGKLEMPVTLIRAKENVATLELLGDDYSLGKACNSTVGVHIVEGNHTNFIQEPHVNQVAELVNGLML